MGPRMDNELHNCEVDAAVLDLFGGMAVGSPRIEDVVSEAGHSGDTIVEDRYGNKTMANGRVEVHDYIKDVHNAPTSKDVGEYYTDAVLELLRAKYHSTPKPQLAPACYGAVDIGDDGSGDALPPAYAAIHIRRGDVTEDAHPRRFTPNDSYLPLLRSLVARHPDLPIIIFSQGRPDDFEELIHALKSSTVALCLDEDVRARASTRSFVQRCSWSRGRRSRIARACSREVLFIAMLSRMVASAASELDAGATVVGYSRCVHL